MLTRRLILASLAFLVSACSLLPQAHRPEITQGNVIEQKSIDQLRLGMNKEQVQFLMGTPALQDIFHPNRWDYIHYINQQDEPVINKQIALFFNNGVLDKVKSEQFDISHLKKPTVDPMSVAAAAVNKVKKAPKPDEQAMKAIQQWQQAWSNQDAAAYIDSYTSNYRTKKLSHNAWRTMRAQRLTKPSSINISIDNVNLKSLDNETFRATFEQTYRADQYQDKALKELILRKIDDAWKISNEDTLKQLK